MHIREKLRTIGDKTRAPSQRAKARALGVDHTTYHRWLAGTRIPSLEALLALADRHGLTLSALLLRVDDVRVLARKNTTKRK